MAISSDHEFAPTQIARAVFPTAFRGYDQDAVRRYLSRLSSALEHQQEYAGLGELEARTPAHERVEQLEAELEDLRDEIRDLELELVQRSVDGDPVSEAAQAEEDGSVFDEHRAIELLGQETARVLESARSAAADILKRAETQAASLKAQAKSELAEASRKAESIVNDAQADTDARVSRLTSEAEAHADQVASEAEEHRTAVLEESSKILTEAEALAEAGQAEAEERAKQTVADAETLRQQVISELVAERREAQSEMDRMTAARDRLAMSLAVARSELDEVADALVDVSNIAVHAEAASGETDQGDAAKTKDGPSLEAEVDELIEGLSPEATESAEIADDDPSSSEAQPAADTPTREAKATRGSGRGATKKKRGKRRQATKQPTKTAKKAKATTESTLAAEPELAAEPDAESDVDVEAEQLDLSVEVDSEPESQPVESSDEGPEIDLDPDTESDPEVIVIDPQPTDDRTADSGAELNTLPADGQELSLIEGFTTIDLTDTEPDQQDPGAAERNVDEVDVDGDGESRDLVHSVVINEPPMPEEVITTVTSRTAMAQPDRTRGDLLIDEPFTGRLPKEFAARDRALTRSGPNFRRQLRRALNDDQSDVLDRLRAGRGEIKVDELPSFGDQIDRYLAPLRRGLAEIAQAGAKAGGQSDLSQNALDNLVRQLAKYIVDKVRITTIQVVQESSHNDREQILEPVRALYRDFRNVGLPDLTEDALYEAFAIGLYDSIEPSAPISWIIDPRSDPDPVCEINAERDDIAKGVVFPSGHARPLSLPGCRCLVMVAAY